MCNIAQQQVERSGTWKRVGTASQPSLHVTEGNPLVKGLEQALEVGLLLSAKADEGQHEQRHLVGRARLAQPPQHEYLCHRALAGRRRRAEHQAAPLQHPRLIQRLRLQGEFECDFDLECLFTRAHFQS